MLAAKGQTVLVLGHKDETQPKELEVAWHDTTQLYFHR